LSRTNPLPQRKSVNFNFYGLASSLFKAATQYYSQRFGIGLPEIPCSATWTAKGRSRRIRSSR